MTTPTRATPNRLRLVLYFLVAAGAILYLPYFVPQRPTASDSYLFGYNNRVGVILLLLFATAGAVWTGGCDLALSAAGATQRMSRRVLAACLAVTFSGCAAMSLFAGRFAGLAESSYEIDRIWFLSQGKRPYIDFEWPFGIYSLYGPVWLSRILHLSVPQSYTLFWTIASVAGVAILFAVVNLTDYPNSRKNTIFLLLYAPTVTSIFTMGTHYTLVRYALPLLFILIVYRVSANRRGHNQSLAALLATVFTLCLLLVSPEMAIAHAFACAVVLWPARSAVSPGAMRTPLYLAMLAGLAALFAAAFRLHLLDTMLASGGGADSFPIPLSLPTLFFFGVVFVCAFAVVRGMRQSEVSDNSVALIVISIPMLAAALGRCDPGHMFFNGLGLYLAASLYLSSGAPRSWSVYRNLFVVCAIALPSLGAMLFLGPSLGMAAMRTVAEDSLPGHSRGVISRVVVYGIEHMPASATKTKELDRLQKVQLLVPPQTIDFAMLYPGVSLPPSDGVFEAPLGYKPNSIGSYLSPRIDYGFYEGLENANTPAAVARKIAELSSHPQRSILLREGDIGACGVDTAAERHLIRKLFIFPYLARPSHLESVHQPLCDYISTHYRMIRSATLEDYRYELWVQAPATIRKLERFTH